MEDPTNLSPGVIRGRVYTHTAEPAREVEVTFAAAQPDAAADALPIPSRVTDDNGNFVCNDLSLGEWYVSAANEKGAASEEVRLNTKSPIVEVVLILEPGGAVSGYVRDEQGGSVAGATLIPVMHDTEHLSAEVQSQFTMRTDDSGYFAQPMIPEGAWQFLARAKGFADTLSAPIRAGTQDNIITIRRGARVLGRVVEDESGSVLPGITIAANRNTVFGSAALSVSDEQGAVEFLVDTNARYVFTAQTPPYVLVDDPVVLDVLNAEQQSLEFRVTRGGEIRGGVLFDDGEPCTECGIVMSRADDARQHIFRAQCDNEGLFVFEGLPAGEYRLSVRGADSAPLSTLGSDRQRASLIPPEIVRDVNFVISRPNQVSGIVITESGEPVSGATVRARSGELEASAVTGEDGTFATGGLQDGSVARVFASTMELASDPALTVTIGDQAARDLRIVVREQARNSVAGTVYDNASVPLRSSVMAVRQGADLSERPGSAATFADGRFVITGLTDGDYRFIVRPPNGLPEDCGGASLFGGQLVRDLRLVYPSSMGLHLAGVVVDETGIALPASIRVTSANEGGRVPRGSARTGTDGSFRIENLDAGDYVLRVRSSGYVDVQTEPVAAGSENIVIEMFRNPVVLGNVIVSSGEAVKAFDIELTRTSQPRAIDSPPAEARRLSVRNAEGQFKLDVEPGRYEIFVSTPDGRSGRVDTGYLEVGDALEVTVQLEG